MLGMKHWAVFLCWNVLVAADPPQRIVSTAPSITETLFALGAEGQLVGVTSYCHYPPAARSKLVVGDFATPNLETVLQLRPDLVIVLADRGDLIERFAAFSLPLLVLPQGGLDEVFESIRLLGNRTGREQAAGDLVDSMKRQLEGLRQPVHHRRPRTLFLVGRNSGSLSDLYAVGSNGYLGQMLEIAGAENIAAGAPGAYPKFSLEEVLRRDPEVIIDLSHGVSGPNPQAERQSRELWAKFPSLAAVRDGRVHVLDDDVFLIPGPRLVEAVAKLVRVIHGETR